MSKDRMLVVLVLTDVFLAFSVIGAELFFHWTLPTELQSYTQPDLFSSPSLWGFSRAMLWAASIGLTIAAWIGLLNYWSAARRLYLAAWGTWFLLTLCSGPSVMTSLGAMFSVIEGVVGGVIVGLVYFSELARNFERRPIEAPAAA